MRRTRLYYFTRFRTDWVLWHEGWGKKSDIDYSYVELPSQVDDMVIAKYQKMLNENYHFDYDDSNRTKWEKKEKSPLYTMLPNFLIGGVRYIGLTLHREDKYGLHLVYGFETNMLPEHKNDLIRAVDKMFTYGINLEVDKKFEDKHIEKREYEKSKFEDVLFYDTLQLAIDKSGKHIKLDMYEMGYPNDSRFD